jgi:tRNA pseudouridine55 synthase
MTAPPPVRAPRRRVDGVLLLDKPLGLSSNAALQRAKRLYAAEKAGHTGTLDPLASGLLPLAFGDATKFAQSLLDARKGYRATVRFGASTTTGDAEGSVVREAPVGFGAAELEAALRRFTGRVRQVPPRYAALKFEGRAYYDYARAGVDIPRKAREVEIESLELVDWTPPDAVVDVRCGKGTYIRVLAEDLGEALGCCAHLAALRRTASGPFTLDRAVTLEALEALPPAARDALLLPVDAPLGDLPRCTIDAAGAASLLQGRPVPVPGPGGAGVDPGPALSADPAEGTRVRGYGPTGFLGLLAVDRGSLRPVRLVRGP